MNYNAAFQYVLGIDFIYNFFQDLNPTSIMNPKMVLVLFFLKLLSLGFCSIITEEKNDHVVYSVVSGSAHLPCNITPPLGTKGKNDILKTE